MAFKDSPDFQPRPAGVMKRTQARIVGLFIDGSGLDRATRRMQRKVDLAALIRGVSSGLPPAVSRYYTIIPYEDDARHLAFLDAVHRAGMDVVVKRLPPKGVNRQVTADVEMAADIMAFSLGLSEFSSLSLYRPAESCEPHLDAVGAMGRRPAGRRLDAAAEPTDAQPTHQPAGRPAAAENTKRIVTVVCPSRDLSYPISLARELGADTVTADFGKFNSGDVLKAAAKWIDLSDSETIWRE